MAPPRTDGDFSPVRIARPLIVGKDNGPDFETRKSPKTICLAFLHGSCPNGRNCYLVHPARQNILDAITLLIEKNWLGGSENKYYVEKSERRKVFGLPEICLLFLKNACRQDECKWLHVSPKYLAYFVEPLDSRYHPGNSTGDRVAVHSKVLNAPTKGPSVLIEDGSSLSINQMDDTVAKTSSTPPASSLPTTYDESSESSSDPTHSESEDSSLSGQPEHITPQSAATPRLTIQQPTDPSRPSRLDVPNSFIPLDVCRDYYRTGVCLRGATCKYEHMRPTSVASRQTNAHRDLPHAGPRPNELPALVNSSSLGRGAPMPVPPESHNRFVCLDSSSSSTLDTRTATSPPREPHLMSVYHDPRVRLPRPASNLFSASYPVSSTSRMSAPSMTSNGRGLPPLSLPSGSAIPRAAEEEGPMRHGNFNSDGYCYEYLQRGSCTRSPRCTYRHEFPPGWRHKQNDSSLKLLASQPTVSQPHNVSQPEIVSQHLAIQHIPASPSTRPTKSPSMKPFLPPNPNFGFQVEDGARPSHPGATTDLVPTATAPPRAVSFQPPAQGSSYIRDSVILHTPPTSRLERHLPHPSPGLSPSMAGSQRSGTAPSSAPPPQVPHPTRRASLNTGTTAQLRLNGQSRIISRPLSTTAIAISPFKTNPPPSKALPPPRQPIRPEPTELTVDVLSPMRATFGPGFTINDIALPNDSHVVNIERLPRETTREAVENVVKAFGSVTEIRMPELSGDPDDQRNIRVLVFLASHEDAVVVVEALDGATVLGTTLAVSLRLKYTAREQAIRRDLLVSWRIMTITGYGGYTKEKKAIRAIATRNETSLDGYWVKASWHQGPFAISQFNVVFEGLPPKITMAQLRHFSCTEDVMIDYRPPDISVPENFGLKDVERTLRSFGFVDNWDVTPAPYKDSVVRARCRFRSLDVAGLAATNLDGTRPKYLKGEVLNVRRVCTFTYHIKHDIYCFIMDDVKLLKKYAEERYEGCVITIAEREVKNAWPDEWTVTAFAEAEKDLSAIKARLVDMVRGETIMDGNRPLWDQCFGERWSRDWLGSVKLKHPGTLILLNFARREIRVVGVSEKRQLIIREIRQYHASMQNTPIHTVDLPTNLPGPTIWLSLHREFSAVQCKYGSENVWLDLEGRRMCARGDEAMYEELQRMAHRALERHTPGALAVADKCPVCLEAHTTPIELPCGHKYCKQCLVGYLGAAQDTRQFPVMCFGDDGKCKEPVPLVIAREVLPPGTWDALLRTAFEVHVGARPDKFRYCPTPDCPQVYRPGPRNTVYSCPDCLVRICPHCHVEYHEGVTCFDRELDTEAGFEEYVRKNSVKQCPGCRMWIQRTEGCNHMVCSLCHTHTCWVCMKTFPNGNGIYKHMDDEHKGWGAEQRV